MQKVYESWLVVVYYDNGTYLSLWKPTRMASLREIADLIRNMPIFVRNPFAAGRLPRVYAREAEKVISMFGKPSKSNRWIGYSRGGGISTYYGGEGYGVYRPAYWGGPKYVSRPSVDVPYIRTSRSGRRFHDNLKYVNPLLI